MSHLSNDERSCELSEGGSGREHVLGGRRAHPYYGASYIREELGEEAPIVKESITHWAKTGQLSFSF